VIWVARLTRFASGCIVRGRSWPPRRPANRGARGAAPAASREPHPPRGAGGAEKSDGLLRQEERDAVSLFGFIAAQRACHPVSLMARVLGVSRQGYLAWSHRPASRRALDDTRLLREIRRIHNESDGTYGSPRIHAQLPREGIRVGRKRVERLMAAAGLQGVPRPRRKPGTTVRVAGGPAGARPGRPRLHRQGPQPPMGGAHQADRQRRGTLVPGGGGRLLLAPLRGLVDERANRRGTRPLSAAARTRSPTTDLGADPSLRPGRWRRRWPSRVGYGGGFDPPRARRGRVAVAADPGRVPVIAVVTVL
jgi:hypothetical protein